MVSRRTTKRVAGVAGTALTGGGLLVGLSRVAPLSLAILGATLVIAIVVLAFTGYKVVDRLLRHVERQSPDRLKV